MLDSNKDNLKLDAMRRFIGLIAKGRDAADLFSAVVKNVVSKNMETKESVYVYLMRYDEEQQDLALLSIATFQRGLKDPNQLIRASTLRVLSSIRVPTTATIMMLAIQDTANDMSPCIRRTAANAIIKLYALDPKIKEDLILIIKKLLADKTITYEDEKQSFHDDDTNETAKSPNNDDDSLNKRTYIMDSDHQLLLRCAKPLL
ncbi:unnamed protein product [Rotaria sp. Silwood2]|nr:unnamed protein product [Rotaria sp. Silwood2]CAF4322570.1 unnamed protein product [Rotaria sp. Silwood2]